MHSSPTLVESGLGEGLEDPFTAHVSFAYGRTESGQREGIGEGIWRGMVYADQW